MNNSSRASKLRIESVDSLTTYLQLIEDSLADTNESLWFRGSGQYAKTLIPSLYRHPTITTTDDLLGLESKLLTYFQQRSIPFVNRAFSNDWERLFYMQHFGVPTRLLDWTENPFVALYFALSCSRQEETPTGLQYKSPVSVWVLRPGLWNMGSLNRKSIPIPILSIGDPNLNGHTPNSDRSYETVLQDYPVGLYGTHNSARITAQRGVFTVFGRNTQPMEEIFELDAFDKDALFRIDIEAEQVEKLSKSLTSLGTQDSVIYPDLEGLAKETKRRYGFRI